MSAIHSNPLKMPIIDIHEGLPYSSLMMLVNFSQYRGIVGMFNHCFTRSSLNYSYFSKKHHNYDTFTLAVGLVILIFWHLINILSNWKLISCFLPDLVGICYFFKKDPIFKYDWCLRSSHLPQSHYY